MVLYIFFTILVFPFALLAAITRWCLRRNQKRSPGFPRKVAVIGGGIAGCGVAWSLKRSGFDVVIYEARDTLGGNAKTHDWEGDVTTGLSVLAWPFNYFHNYNNLMSEMGVDCVPVSLPFFIQDMQMGIFAHDKDSLLRQQFSIDLTRWERLVRTVRWVNQTLAWGSSSPSLYDMSLLNPFNVIPLRLLVFLFGISGNFWRSVLVPMYSSCFLTVNQNYIPATVVPLLDDLIPLLRVPKLHTWTTNSQLVFQKMTENVTVYLGQAVTSVRRVNDNEIYVRDSRGNTEKYNSIVFACPADSVVRIIQSPSLLEYILLYWVSYTDDTDKSFQEGLIHHDVTVLPEEYRGNLLDTYSNYIELNHLKDGTVSVENTFILSSWIPAVTRKKNSAMSSHGKNGYSKPGTNHNSEKTTISSRGKKHNSEKTAMSSPGTNQNSENSAMFVTYNTKKVLNQVVGRVNNSRAHPNLCFMNLAIVVILRFVQGYKNTYFCGSFTTPANGHDLSLLSGLVVARAIGAEYPFSEDKDALSDFKKLCWLMGM